MTIPVYLKNAEGDLIRVGWADAPDRGIIIDAEGEGRDFYNEISQGLAQGFTFGEE